MTYVQIILFFSMVCLFNIYWNLLNVSMKNWGLLICFFHFSLLVLHIYFILQNHWFKMEMKNKTNKHKDSLCKHSSSWMCQTEPIHGSGVGNQDKHQVTSCCLMLLLLCVISIIIHSSKPEHFQHPPHLLLYWFNQCITWGG